MFEDLFNFNIEDDIFNWDKKSYKFNREEKDMHPYSIKTGEKEVLITHNILGINKEDLKITKEIDNGRTYILIQGKTKDSLTDKVYSIDSRFALNDAELDLTKITATSRNGLLYITIPTKTEEAKKSIKQNIAIM